MEGLVKSQDFGVRIIPAFKALLYTFQFCSFAEHSELDGVMRDRERERESDLMVAWLLCHDQ